MYELCVYVLGPLAGPQKLRIDEQQSYDRDRDFHYRDSSLEGHLLKSNSSADRIHIMISWKVRDISVDVL